MTDKLNTSSRAIGSVLIRELRLGLRNRGELLTPLIFVAAVAMLFPLGLGPDPARLAEVAPGVIWITALLASLLSLGNLFVEDYRDGSLEQLLASPWSLSAIALAKVTAHWLLTGLPICLLAPAIGYSYNLSGEGIWMLLITLLLGTPTLAFIGGIGVALSVGLRRGGMFLALLVLPLFVPVLIFATAGVVSATAGMPVSGHLYFLAGLLVLSATLAPPAIAASLRISCS